MEGKIDYVTDLPLKCLKLVGQDLHGKRALLVYNSLFITAVMSVALVLSFMELILHNEGPKTWAGTFEVFTVGLQIMMKLITYRYYNKSIKKLVKDKDEKFWPIDSAGLEVETRIHEINRIVNLGIKAFLYTDVCTTIGMMICAVAVGGHTLPVTLYHIIDFNRNDYYSMVFVWFIFFGYQVTLFLNGFDGLFVALITAASSQLRLLKRTLSDLPLERANMELIKKYVDHHIFVLDFVDKIQNMYSLIFLAQFFISCTAVCMGIFLIATSGFSDLGASIPAFVYLMANLIELFLYCITGSHVKSQMETLGDAVYDSEWWLTGGSHMRNAAIMIIQRSQGTKSLQAIGIVDLDVQTYVAVVRLSFSFYVLMQSVGV